MPPSLLPLGFRVGHRRRVPHGGQGPWSIHTHAQTRFFAALKLEALTAEVKYVGFCTGGERLSKTDEFKVVCTGTLCECGGERPITFETDE